jgi:hypothetical protein
MCYHHYVCTYVIMNMLTIAYCLWYCAIAANYSISLLLFGFISFISNNPVVTVLCYWSNFMFYGLEQLGCFQMPTLRFQHCPSVIGFFLHRTFSWICGIYIYDCYNFVLFCVSTCQSCVLNMCTCAYIQGVSKKTLRKLNRLSCIINVAKQFNFYIGRKNSY